MRVKDIDTGNICVGDYLYEAGQNREIIALNIISPHEADVVLTDGHVLDISEVDQDKISLESEVTG